MSAPQVVLYGGSLALLHYCSRETVPITNSDLIQLEWKLSLLDDLLNLLSQRTYYLYKYEFYTKLYD